MYHRVIPYMKSTNASHMTLLDFLLILLKCYPCSQTEKFQISGPCVFSFSWTACLSWGVGTCFSQWNRAFLKEVTLRVNIFSIRSVVDPISLTCVYWDPIYTKMGKNENFKNSRVICGHTKTQEIMCWIINRHSFDPLKMTFPCKLGQFID